MVSVNKVFWGMETDSARTRSADGTTLVSTINSSFKRSDGIQRSFPARASRVRKIGFSCRRWSTTMVEEVTTGTATY